MSARSAYNTPVKYLRVILIVLLLDFKGTGYFIL